MYKVKDKITKQGRINKINILNLDGYLIKSKNKYFVIEKQKVTDIKVVNDKLIYKLINTKVNKKYNKLIEELTNLLIDEDESNNGNSSINLILDKIEKFRQEIKYKYKSYIDKKDLDKMAKQLRMIQKEAITKLNEQITYTNQNKIGRSK